MNIKKKETILGWLAFFIALATYTLTMERTGSLWDCGEFLSCTYKLQVAHPPGAPFYMLIGKVFSLLAMGDTSKVAMMINWLSAVSGAFCVFFFFGSSVILQKLVLKPSEDELNGSKGNFILITSFLAAVAATFLDSMWFNAIEGEVYALAICFTALNVWAGLKWYVDDSETADYWLLIIAICTGMSIGVHLLALLAFPMIGLLIYFKKFTPTKFGIILSFILSFGMIFFVMKFMLSWLSYFFGRMDLVFVNTFKLPFYSGSIFGILLLVAFFVWAFKKTENQRNFRFWNESKTKFPLNTFVLIIAFLFMGYISNIVVVIRANANPPINMNVPNNFLTLKSYIDREQYGDRPLLFGPHYPEVGEIENVIEKSEIYYKNDSTGTYDLVGHNRGYEYGSKVKKFFPRLGHDDKRDYYRMWINPKYEVIDRGSNEVVQEFGEGESEQADQFAAQQNMTAQPGQFVVKDKLTFFDNIKYFIQYQVGFMYMRYLLWNTAGRVDDLQGRPNNDYGRWTSGIGFIDNTIGTLWGNVGADISDKPASAKMSKSYNNFYMIPFLLCVIGIFFNYKRDKKVFYALMFLFFTTGLMQILQANSPPVEPRERDYTTSPSFWAFLLWMPFGVYALYEFLSSKISAVPAKAIAILLAVAAPFLMGTQGWDDHNRGNRTSTLAFAKNMLNSCPPNAILFNYGDNDTYPLWYAQEVEGIRPDIRVINTSLVEGDAYISQLRLPMNGSAPVKLSFPQSKVNGESRNYFRSSPNPLSGDSLSLQEIIAFLMNDDQRTKVTYQNGMSENFIPTTHAYMDIDPARVIKAGFLVTKDKMGNIPTRIPIELPATLSRGALVQLDIIANNIYDRPICFASSNPSVTGLGIRNYLQTDGMVIKFTPTGYAYPNGMEAINSDDMYGQVMKYDFGKIKENNILIDEHTSLSYISMKHAISSLALFYAGNGKADTVAKLLDHLYTNIPKDKMVIGYTDIGALQAATVAKNEKYTKLLSNEMYTNSTAVLDWMTNAKNKKTVNPNQEEIRMNLVVLNQVKEMLSRNGDTALPAKITQKLNMYQESLGIRLQ